MATEIHFQGGSIDVDETFNFVRKRLNDGARQVEDYRNGSIEGKNFEPFHALSFKTEGGGRICVNPEKVICVTSDEAKD